MLCKNIFMHTVGWTPIHTKLLNLANLYAICNYVGYIVYAEYG